MIKVRTSPEAPTRHPATINAVFEITIPAKAAATPDNEFNNEITTGISPPPIGKTKNIPARIETISKTINPSLTAKRIGPKLNKFCKTVTVKNPR